MAEFKLTDKMELDTAALRISDQDRMTEFYRDVLGFDFLREENGMAVMGTKENKKEIISLNLNPDAIRGSVRHAGLYHIAILLPTRKDLGSILRHLLEVGYPIDGASEHGYSEAIYLTDPEGNGLEIYRDRPMSEWTINPDGTIDGVTERMDVDGVLAEAEPTYQGMPTGTKVGHVHLSVSDLAKSGAYYQNALGFDLKNDLVPGAKFLAAGNYHHHLGLNIWESQGAAKLADDFLGLDYVTVRLPDLEALIALKDNLSSQGVEFYFNQGKQILQISDPDNMSFWFFVKKSKKENQETVID